MAWNRLYLRNKLKSRLLMDRNINDGLLPDSLLNEVIEDAMKQVARDTNLLPSEWRIPLRSGQYKYPLPIELDRIMTAYFIDSSGNYEPLKYVTAKNYLSWQDPTETDSEPFYYSYPHYQPRVFHFQALAPPVEDYIDYSWITTKSIRTVIDSGANFGRTLSGRRIRPKCVVQNLSDGSYGYVEYLDMSVAKTTGTAEDDTTTDLLVDSSEDFVADDVEVGHIICTPSTGRVRAYAFVTSVATSQLGYDNIEGRDANGEKIRRFESLESYKVGKATEIRLWHGVPTPQGVKSAEAGYNHPGLRYGVQNIFDVESVLATITGTTFANTTVTGSSTTGATSGAIALASGGSHGLIEGIEANELTVDKWIGGVPTAGEEVTVQNCDKYQIEDVFAEERQIWIGPPASASDAVGSESIHLYGNRVPQMPEEDDDPLEIPEHYEQALLACGKWQAAEMMGVGIFSLAEIAAFQTVYNETTRPLRGDVWRPPMDGEISPYANRMRAARRGRRDQTASGLWWNLDS